MGEGTVAQGACHSFLHIGIRCKATRTDVWADGGPDVAGFTAEGICHSPDGFACDIRCGAPPAGMNSAYGSGNRIIEQNRGAVGGEHHQGKARRVGDQTVALRVVAVGNASRGVGCQNGSAGSKRCFWGQNPGRFLKCGSFLPHSRLYRPDGRPGSGNQRSRY